MHRPLSHGLSPIAIEHDTGYWAGIDQGTAYPVLIFHQAGSHETPTEAEAAARTEIQRLEGALTAADIRKEWIVQTL